MSPQLSLHLSSSLRYSSDSFLIHEGVRPVVEGVLTLGLTKRFALVYIQGSASAGKTHLAVYLAGALREQVRHVRVVAGESGVAWYTEELPLKAIRSGEIVLIDDADLLLKATEGTGIFGDIVERVRLANGLLVLLGRVAASELPTDPYTRSRVEAGINLFVGAPPDGDLDRLLSAIVRQRGLLLTEAKRAFILKRIPRTMAAMVEYVDRLERAGDASALSTSFEVLAEAVPMGVVEKPLEGLK